MTTSDSQNVFLGRQPIIDRKQQLFAYELLFRSNNKDNENFASFVDSNQASAIVIVNAFTELSTSDALGPYQGFIKVDHGFIFSDLINTLPPQSVVLELSETIAQTPELTARCEYLCSNGYILAATERTETMNPYNPLFRLTEIIKIDIGRVNQERLKQLVTSFKPLGKTLLAEKVETHEHMELCSNLGFDLFQGYYFAKPTVIKGKRLQSSEIILLKLLGLLNVDAPDAEIEQVFKQEPVLTMNLLRLTNSAASGLSHKITSLRHAVTVLGRRQLLRWLQLLLYTGLSGDGMLVNPLLQLAATRGRLMELLMERVDVPSEDKREVSDQAYMVGILSLLPVLLSTPMADIIERLPLSPNVSLALKNRSGVFGTVLALIEVLEELNRNDMSDAINALLESLPGIDIHYANNCLIKALSWANNLDKDPS